MVNHIRLFAGIRACSHLLQSRWARRPGRGRGLSRPAPIRIVIGFSPGGGSDLAGSAVAEKLAQKWGKPVIVENKTGAQGNLAMAQVAKAAPDGYTLAVVPVGNAAVNPSLFKELPYDMKEFAPISQIAESRMSWS